LCFEFWISNFSFRFKFDKLTVKQIAFSLFSFDQGMQKFFSLLSLLFLLFISTSSAQDRGGFNQIAGLPRINFKGALIGSELSNFDWYSCVNTISNTTGNITIPAQSQQCTSFLNEFSIQNFLNPQSSSDPMNYFESLAIYAAFTMLLLVLVLIVCTFTCCGVCCCRCPCKCCTAWCQRSHQFSKRQRWFFIGLLLLFILWLIIWILLIHFVGTAELVPNAESTVIDAPGSAVVLVQSISTSLAQSMESIAQNVIAAFLLQSNTTIQETVDMQAFINDINCVNNNVQTTSTNCQNLINYVVSTNNLLSANTSLQAQAQINLISAEVATWNASLSLITSTSNNFSSSPPFPSSLLNVQAAQNLTFLATYNSSSPSQNLTASQTAQTLAILVATQQAYNNLSNVTTLYLIWSNLSQQLVQLKQSTASLQSMLNSDLQQWQSLLNFTTEQTELNQLSSFAANTLPCSQNIQQNIQNVNESLYNLGQFSLAEQLTTFPNQVNDSLNVIFPQFNSLKQQLNTIQINQNFTHLFQWINDTNALVAILQNISINTTALSYYSNAFLLLSNVTNALNVVVPDVQSFFQNGQTKWCVNQFPLQSCSAQGDLNCNHTRCTIDKTRFLLLASELLLVNTLFPTNISSPSSSFITCVLCQTNFSSNSIFPSIVWNPALITQELQSVQNEINQTWIQNQNTLLKIRDDVQCAENFFTDSLESYVAKLQYGALDEIRATSGPGALLQELTDIIANITSAFCVAGNVTFDSAISSFLPYLNELFPSDYEGAINYFLNLAQINLSTCYTDDCLRSQINNYYVQDISTTSSGSVPVPLSPSVLFDLFLLLPVFLILIGVIMLLLYIYGYGKCSKCMAGCANSCICSFMPIALLFLAIAFPFGVIAYSDICQGSHGMQGVGRNILLALNQTVCTTTIGGTGTLNHCNVSFPVYNLYITPNLLALYDGVASGYCNDNGADPVQQVLNQLQGQTQSLPQTMLNDYLSQSIQQNFRFRLQQLVDNTTSELSVSFQQTLHNLSTVLTCPALNAVAYNVQNDMCGVGVSLYFFIAGWYLLTFAVLLCGCVSFTAFNQSTFASENGVSGGASGRLVSRNRRVRKYRMRGTFDFCCCCGK
jgi:hypothetical protein